MRARHLAIPIGAALALAAAPAAAHEHEAGAGDEGVSRARTPQGARRRVGGHRARAGRRPRPPAKLAFEFMDGTNLGAHPAHMQRLVLTTAGDDRHQEEWTFLDGGKPVTMSMDLQRKR